MKAKKAKVNKVLLILRTTGSGREILQGAIQYARTDPYCSVQMELMPDPRLARRRHDLVFVGMDEVGIGALAPSTFKPE